MTNNTFYKNNGIDPDFDTNHFKTLKNDVFQGITDEKNVYPVKQRNSHISVFAIILFTFH